MRRSNWFITSALVVILGALFTLGSALSFAAVPDSINFQGILRDGGGSPVPNSTYNVTFAIYTTPVGGALLWSETQPVTTVSGLFNVFLGQSTHLPISVFSAANRFVGIQVSPDPPMAQRIPLTSAGFASVTSRVNGDISTFGDADSSVLRVGPPAPANGHIKMLNRLTGQGDTLGTQWLGFITEAGDTVISFYNASINAGGMSGKPFASNLNLSKSNINRIMNTSDDDTSKIVVLGETIADTSYSLICTATTVKSSKSNGSFRMMETVDGAGASVVFSNPLGDTSYSLICTATTVKSSKSNGSFRMMETVDSTGSSIIFTDSLGDTTVSISDLGARFKNVFAQGGNGWLTSGNTLTGPSASPNEWIGSLGNHDWIVKTNNSERMRVNSVGNVGIGITAPGTPLAGC